MTWFIRNVLIAVLALPVLSLGETTEANQRTPATEKAEVAVIWDATKEADCTLEVQEWDAPTPRSIPCPPGSVIYAEEMTRARATRMEGKVVKLSANQKHNEAAIDAAVKSVHDLADPVQARAAQACSGNGKRINGSYAVSPNGFRVLYTMEYRVNGCNVTNVRDSAATTSLGNRAVQWEKSCTNGNNSCRQRNIVLRANSPTAIYNEDNSQYDREYRNVAFDIDACRRGGCVRAYGYYRFD